MKLSCNGRKLSSKAYIKTSATKIGINDYNMYVNDYNMFAVGIMQIAYILTRYY